MVAGIKRHMSLLIRRSRPRCVSTEIFPAYPGKSTGRLCVSEEVIFSAYLRKSSSLRIRRTGRLWLSGEVVVFASPQKLSLRIRRSCRPCVTRGGMVSADPPKSSLRIRGSRLCVSGEVVVLCVYAEDTLDA